MSDHFSLDVDPDHLRRTRKWLDELGEHLSSKGGTVAGTPAEIGQDWTGTAATSIKGEMTALGDMMKGSWATSLESLSTAVDTLEEAYRDALDRDLPDLNRRWREAQQDYDQAVRAAENSYDSTTGTQPGGRPPSRWIREESADIRTRAIGDAEDDLDRIQGNLQDEYDDLVADLKRKTRDLSTSLGEHTPIDVPASVVTQFQTNGSYPEVLSPAGRIQGLPMTVLEAYQTVTTDAPSLSDPGFDDWYANLSPAEQQVYITTLSWGMDFEDFDPRSAITPGGMPKWADSCLPGAEKDDWGTPMRVKVDGEWVEYGYKGGGTIDGPGGVAWPIMLPYVEKDGALYMDDVGRRPDGGIMQLDGHDPGWTSVASYRGVNQYQEISAWVPLAGFVAGLEGNRVHPGAVYVTRDGRPTLTDPLAAGAAGVDAQGRAPGAPTLPNGDPLNGAGLDRWDRITTGADVLGAGLQAYNTVDSVASHEQRPWYIDYQINEDGRRRAIVRTFQADVRPDGTKVLGSFGNTFNSEDTTEEYTYNSRMNVPTIGRTDVVRTSQRDIPDDLAHRHVDLTKDLSKNE